MESHAVAPICTCVKTEESVTKIYITSSILPRFPLLPAPVEKRGVRMSWAVTRNELLFQSWCYCALGVLTLAPLNSDLMKYARGKDLQEVIKDSSIKVSKQSGAAVKREVGWMDTLKINRKYIKGLPV